MSICDVPVIAEVCGFVGDTAAAVISAPFEFLAAAVGAAASWLFQAAWLLIDQTTLVDLTNPGYLGVYNLLFGVAVVVMLIFFLAQLITGMIRRDPGALTRAALGTGKAVLGAFLVITLATLLLEVTDQLTIGIVQAAGLTMEGMGLRLGVLLAGLATLSIASPGVGIIVTLFLGCLAIVGTAMVWFSLLIRKALLLAAIVLAPIALAGAAWDATRAWFGRWAAFVLALIVSKLVVVVIFLVAIVQADAPITLDLQSIADPAAGVVLLMVAAFAPYLVYRLISFAGVDMYHAISSEQEAKDAMNRPLPLPGPGLVPQGGAPDAGQPDPPAAAPAATEAAPAAEGGSTVAASEGGAATSASAASTAGPAAAVIIGAEVIKGTAEAGPRFGSTVGSAAEGQATQASTPPAPPSTPVPPSSESPWAPPAPPRGDA